MGQRVSAAEPPPSPPPPPPPSSSSSSPPSSSSSSHPHHTATVSKNFPIEPLPENPKYKSNSNIPSKCSNIVGIDADWTALYPSYHHETDLDSPFSEHEIFLAVFDPDSSLCFFQAFWPFLKPDLLALFDQFHRSARIAPAPAFANGAFRLVHRVLASRLRLPTRSKAQFILDSVASAKAVLDSRRVALFVRLEFDHPFDTVAWDFLIRALRSRGAGPRWAVWVDACLFSRMDAERRRGLIHGDPLSSCLFAIAVDAFAAMLRKGRLFAEDSAWTNGLASLEHARDALVLAPADRGSLVNLKVFLYFFELVSGLCIDFNRSCVYSLRGDDAASALAAGILNCRVGKFPFLYLGMVVANVKVSAVEDDDCYILDGDPYDTTADELKKKILLYGDGENDEEEEDISIVAEKGPVACRDYPHSRHLCAKHPFNKTPHESYCPQCYCYVCDVVAPCAYWTGGSTAHCNASDQQLIWNILRNSRRSPASS